MIKHILRQWLPLALVICAVCGLVYLTTQQALRLGANDPQIQMAEDTAAAITAGTAPMSLVPAADIDIAASLGPFLIVYDATGTVVASSATLNGQSPALPPGVLDYVKANGEDRITWQPQPEVRIAAVIVPIDGSDPGFVLAGRSLKEVENRIGQLELQIGAALVVTLVASLVVVVLLEVILADRRGQHLL